jgi:hypothetical protein
MALRGERVEDRALVYKRAGRFSKCNVDGHPQLYLYSHGYTLLNR